MDPVVTTTQIAPQAAAGQISLYHLVMQASWPVFLVMLGLGARLDLVLGSHHREVFRRAAHECRQ